MPTSANTVNAESVSRLPDMPELRISDEGARQAFLAAQMSRLLNSAGIPGLDIYTPLEVNGILLGNGAFVMSALAPVKADGRRDYRSLCSAISEQLSASVSSHSINYIFEVDGLIIAISCYARLTDAGTQGTGVLERLCRTSCAAVMSKMREDFGVELSAYVGKLFIGVSRLPDIFARIRQAWEADRFLGTGAGEVRSVGLTPPDDIDECLAAADAGRLIASKLLSGQTAELISYGAEALEHILASPAGGLDILRRRIDRLAAAMEVELSGRLPACPEAADALRNLNRLPSAHDADALMAEFEAVIGSLALLIPNLTHRSDSRVTAIRRYVDENIGDDSLSAEQVAAVFGMSRSQLSTVFKNGTGTKLIDYIHKSRVELASELLRTTVMPVSEICRVSGFGSSATMHRAFRKFCGASPSELRGGQYSL